MMILPSPTMLRFASVICSIGRGLSLRFLPVFSSVVCFALLFRGAGHEKRRAEQLKWSLAFSLYIGSFPCAQLPGPVHTARLGRVFFCVFSLGLYFVYSFVFFYLFVCIHPFVLPWTVESSPLQFWR